jgi:hypothetical protein
MSYDEYDAAMDALYDEMREELTPEIINEFTMDRLQSYYLMNPEVAKPAYLALEEAIKLKDSGFYAASFLFAVIATEVAVKSVLLKPIVNGLVHNLPTSSLVASLVIGQNGFDKLKDLLFQSLNNIAKIDLGLMRRPNSKQNLWEEIIALQKKRNGLVHKAELPLSTDTEMALAVAQEILDKIFPSVITEIGLHLHEQGRTCNQIICTL